VRVIPLSKESYFYVVPDSFVEIVRLDFLTETSRLLLCTRAPDTDHDNPFVCPRICGDLAVMGMNVAEQDLLINWNTQSCIVLQSSSVRQMKCLVK
jgi:hypothetical protein